MFRSGERTLVEVPVWSKSGPRIDRDYFLELGTDTRIRQLQTGRCIGGINTSGRSLIEGLPVRHGEFSGQFLFALQSRWKQL